MTVQYMSKADIARMYGVTRGAITFWDLPEPDVRVGHADGWKRETIEQWYEQHNEASRA